MTIRFDLEKPDAISYLFRTLGKRERERMISAIIILPLVVFMLISSKTTGDLVRTILFIFLFVGVFGAISDFYHKKSQLKKFRERNPHILPLGKYEINVTETGMNIEWNSKSSMVAWDEIWHSDETKKYFILYVSEKAPVVIPKYRIPTHEVEELRSLLLKYIPEYRG